LSEQSSGSVETAPPEEETATEQAESPPTEEAAGSRLMKLDELDSSADLEDRAVGFFSAFDKLLRATRLYEGRGALVERLLQDLIRRAEHATAQGELTVRVAPFGMLLGKTQVTQADTRLTEVLFGLFCDGIREFTFTPGIGREELQAFTDVLISDPRTGEDDYTTLLWKRELPHIHFYATDTLQTGMDGSDDADEGLLAAAERSQIRAEGGGRAQEVVLSPDDLRMLKAEDGLAWIKECAAPMRVGEVQAKTLESVQAAFESPWDHARFLQMAVRAAEEHPEIPSPLVLGMFESMVASGDTKGVARLLEASAEAARFGGYAAKNLRKALFGVERIEALAIQYARHTELLEEAMHGAAVEHPEAVIALLNKLDPGPARDSLKTALTDAGVDMTPFYSRCLNDPNEEIVIDAIGALSKTDTPEAVRSIADALGYTSTRVRRVALEALVGHYPEEARVALSRALADPDRDNRLLALRILKDSGDRRMAGSILSRIQGSTFSSRDEKEQNLFIQALASFKDPRTASYFAGLITGGGFSRGQAAHGRQLLAVEALAGIRSDDAKLALKKASKKWGMAKDVKEAAKRALAAAER
jgi:hypothetical protein